jgi:hypothetical protein
LPSLVCLGRLGEDQSSLAPLDRNSQTFAERPREEGGADESPTCLPEGEKGLLASAVGAYDPVKINIDFSGGTALGDGIGQAICPFPNKLPTEDDSDSVS